MSCIRIGRIRNRQRRRRRGVRGRARPAGVSACGSRLTGSQAALAQGAFGHSGNGGSGSGVGTGAQALGVRPRRPAAGRLLVRPTTTTSKSVRRRRRRSRSPDPRRRRRARPRRRHRARRPSPPAWPPARPAAAGPPASHPGSSTGGAAATRPPWPACRTARGVRRQRQPGAGRRQRRRHRDRRHGDDHHRRQHLQHQRRRAGPHPERAAGDRGLGRLRQQHRRHLRPPSKGPALRRRQRLGHELRRRVTGLLERLRHGRQRVGLRRRERQRRQQLQHPRHVGRGLDGGRGRHRRHLRRQPGRRPLLPARAGQLHQGDLSERHQARGRDLPAGAGHRPARPRTRSRPTRASASCTTPANGIATTPTNANYGTIVQAVQSQGTQYVSEYSDDNSAERLLQAMQQANFAPQVVDWISEEYSPQFAQQTSPESNGDLVAMTATDGYDDAAQRGPAAHGDVAQPRGRDRQLAPGHLRHPGLVGRPGVRAGGQGRSART